MENSRALRRAALVGRLSSVCGAAVALLACVVLAGWYFDVAALKSVRPDWVSMKPNTALAFAFAGVALALLDAARHRPGLALAGRLGAVVVGIFAILILAAYALTLDLGIDQLLLADRSTPAHLHPGRPAPTTAFLFLLTAIALLGLRSERPWARRAVDALAGVVATGAYLGIVGYAYEAPTLYLVPGYSTMALHTALGFLLLGAGMLLRQPDRGLVAIIIGSRAAGVTARHLLPVAVLAPVLLGYALRKAAQAGLLDPGAAILLLIVTFIALFVATLLLSVSTADRIDVERQRLQLARRLDEEQIKANMRLRNLLDSAPDAMIVADAEGRIVLANTQSETLFGHAGSDMIGKPVEMLLPDRLRARHVEHRAGYHRAPQLRPMGAGQNLVGRRADGGEFPIEVSLSPIETEDGMLVSAAIRDATARQRREAELDAARTHAEAASQRLQAVIETTPLAIIELDRDGAVCSWNHAAEAMFGWRANEVMGRKPPTIPVDRQGELDLLLKASNGGTPLRGFDTRRLRKDGTLIDVSVWNAPRRDADGQVVGMLAIAADTTERKLIDERLRQTQRLEAVGQLTGGIAHEFNNLLQAILGNLEILEDKVQGNRDVAENVQRLIRAGRRCAELTHQLLAFSRKQPLRPEPFKPMDELERLSKLVRAALGASYAIHVDVPPDVSHALADTAQLGNALLNLVLNARDAMPNGGPIAIGARNLVLDARRARNLDVAPGRYVAFEVTDTGTGMSPEVAAHAVEPFFTTKEVGKGTGLGLSMVHGFVKQSGGALEIDSEVGKGTTVRVLLPSTAEDASEPPPPLRPRLVGTRNVTVLVVEDEPGVLETAGDMLRGLGYDVIAATDGPAALALQQQAQRVDVLFADVILPKGMSGLDLARLAQARQRDLKVIYTSGYNENVIVHDGVLDDGVTLLRKPYSKEDLLSAIEAATRPSLLPARRRPS